MESQKWDVIVDRIPAGQDREFLRSVIQRVNPHLSTSQIEALLVAPMMVASAVSVDAANALMRELEEKGIPARKQRVVKGETTGQPPEVQGETRSRYCTRCGAALVQDARFCTKCGGNVSAPTSEGRLSMGEDQPAAQEQVDLGKYREFLFAMARFLKEHWKFDKEMTNATDVFGLFKSRIEEKEKSVTDSIQVIQSEIAATEKAHTWTKEMLEAKIADIQQFKAQTFPSEPWLPYKRDVYFLVEPAIADLKLLLRKQYTKELGYDPGILSQQLEKTLGEAANFDSLREGWEDLRQQYVKFGPGAVRSIDSFFEGALVLLMPAAAAALDSLTKKCPQCAEMPKIEALVCRYCGYRFESNQDREERESARHAADKAAIQALEDMSRQETPSSDNPQEGRLQLIEGAIRKVHSYYIR